MQQPILLLLICISYLICIHASDGFSYSFKGGSNQFFFGNAGGPSAPIDNEAYYSLLGVSKTADATAIKRAYRKLAVKLHPDKGGSQEKFKELGEAYQVSKLAERIAALYITVASEKVTLCTAWCWSIPQAIVAASLFSRYLLFTICQHN
jgi:DnaJ domain